MFGLIALFTFLTLFYLDGPAKSVTVRNGTLEVRNSIHQYVIPSSLILSIEYMADLGVFVRVEGHKPIWVGAFSRSQLRWQKVSAGELRANAKSLTDALFATPVRADDRQMENGYRWVNVLLRAACVIALLILRVVAPIR
jgi:hypothetical protein